MKGTTLRRRCFNGSLALLVAAVLLVIDQITKYLVCLYLRSAGTVSVISGLLEFTFLENSGAAFGLFRNWRWLVMAVTIVVSVCICVALFRYRNHTFFSYAALSLLVSGGVGNLIDRFRYGFVIDFIHVLFFDYIFNFADCCVTVGAFFLMIHVALISYKETKEKTAKEDEDSFEDVSQ